MKVMRALRLLSFLSGLTLFGAAFAAGADATATSSAPGAATIKTPEVDARGYLKLSFDQLAGYTFNPPAFDPATKPNEKPVTGEEQIPTVVKSWSGKKVVLSGFMMPVKMDKGLVTEFLLVRNQMACCYGSVPNMNEWVVVKLKKGVQPLMDVPISFYGQLKVGAMFENGYMTGLYELVGERMGDVSS
jgi:hypothetical protein